MGNTMKTPKKNLSKRTAKIVAKEIVKLISSNHKRKLKGKDKVADPKPKMFPDEIYILKRQPYNGLKNFRQHFKLYDASSKQRINLFNIMEEQSPSVIYVRRLFNE